MSVLGHSIARYLGKLGGLYSVELPESLSQEMTELVAFANQGLPNRALLVSDSPPPGAVAVSKWRDVLGWRTSDDRIFTWKRGHREPDSSFRSVVRPFISARFPGARGGECTLAQLVNLGVAELWQRRNRQPVGASFEAFEQTAQWVAGILVAMFEEAGSTPTSHWSDRFLEHWAGMLSDLDAGLAQYASEPDPRHAWEVVRVSGLPLPSAIAAGFNQAPTALEAKEWGALGDLWEDIVQSFVIPEGGMSLLLSVLDRQAIGAVKVSPWRGLPWNLAATLPPGTPAPIVGRLIFRDAASPTLLTSAIPPYPIAPVPSWWGVSSANLDDARKHLREQTPLSPDPSCAGIIRVASGNAELFVLNTRSGQLAAAHTAKRWKSRVRVDDVRIRFKEDWSTLHVSILAPASPVDGDAWINPDQVEVTTKGATVQSQVSSRGPGEQLLVSFPLEVEYAAKIDPDSGHIEGSWNPWRSLRVELRVSRYNNGAWQAGPPVDVEIELVIPSPFGPTVLVSDSGPLQALGPDNQDKFTATALAAPAWTADSTPTILLKKEDRYEVHIYDGTVVPSGQQFAPLAQPVVATLPVGAPTGAMFPTVRRDLDDGVLVSYVVAGTPYDAAVFRVKERSANLSSGLLSAVRGLPAGRKQPAAEARDSLRGRYQQQVVRALCQVSPSAPNSLYQYVVSSADDLSEWGAHPGTPAPMFLFNAPAGGLSGLGSGPSAQLSTSAAWHSFMQSLQRVTSALGIVPGAESAWLSGLDFSGIGASLVREYVQAHATLVQFARPLDPADAFWASFPFSVLVVEGKNGLSLGQLLAVLLSPLHPARLAWTFAVTVIAKQNTGDAALVQLVEGWNVPWAGSAVNTAGQHRQLVAVPTDPGLEQDFAAWSALAVLGDNNVADLPVFAAGRSLPWGGRTGINAKVVERSIKDYLLVHPHANSLEIDVRSVAPAPRAQEIDEALLELVAAESLAEVEQLGGGARIWDSADRRGPGPTRDRLFAVRGNAEPARAFEWRTYDAATAPTEADVALIENASVHLGVIEGATRGVLGLLPLRRFAPPSMQSLRLDQHFAPSSGEDVLGLSDLLREIETPPGLQRPALRATPQAQALGIGRNARWEVLGTFNLDPALLSAVVASASSGSDKRLLWEWRPSWMALERKQGDLARRPYYVVARIPSSLLKALQLRQAFSNDNALQLLGVLGERGIGLAALSAAAGTQESAAAGFFYAAQLLLSPVKAGLAAPALGQQRVLGVIPVDPIESILQGLAGSKLKRRADMLAVVLSVSNTGVAKLCFVPVELKHHGMPSAPEPIPAPQNEELRRAREQLVDTADLLRTLSEELAGPLAPDAVATHYLKHLALATLVDFGLTFTRSPVDPEFRRQMLGAILSGRVELGLGDAILLWFAPGSAPSSGAPCIVDRYGQTTIKQLRIHEVFLDPSTVPGLWWDASPAGPNEVHVRAAVNAVIEKAFAACTAPPSNTTVDLRDLLAQVLQVNAGPAAAPSQPSPIPPGAVPPVEGSAEAPPAADEPVPPAATAQDTSQAPPPAVTDEPRPEAAPSDTPAARTEDVASSAAAREPPTPRAIVGWSEAASRWAVVGQLANSEELVALDLDHPKTVGIFGYMGSGKSYLLGNLIESAVEPLSGINRLEVPLAVVVFNYRRNSSDRFELSSLAVPNSAPADVDRLQREYGAAPTPVRNLHVLCLPGELRPERQLEYGTLGATELYFNPHSLSAEDWELLMGEPGSEAVFARTIRNTLVDLRSAGDITLENLEHQVTTRLTGQSRTAARLRFDFIRRYISEDRGVDFGELLQPGRVLIIDLRQPLFNKDDALRFFLVCANQIARVQGRFNKMLVFDEAHEYMSDAFGERMEARIRLMRHEGTSYVFATQDVLSIPLGINRFLETRFVFDLGTRENVQDLEQVAPEFRGYQLLGIKSGSCFVQANKSTNAMFSRPREIKVRPRVTEHGGGSRIFTRPPDR